MSKSRIGLLDPRCPLKRKLWAFGAAAASMIITGIAISFFSAWGPGKIIVTVAYAISVVAMLVIAFGPEFISIREQSRRSKEMTREK